ncbi:hypothetical protein AQUCO_02200184v1 [Aquilegia coerulea]|uniref:60S ribosomal protein L18a-like protein n=1 Tax=Aquilegia coerulea TaxID=218851 RepID=A0A2G5DEA8_AQUCA|nr:hypothetical protein AQUCO_02200184v1 [Aquilegia coerulea]
MMYEGGGGGDGEDKKVYGTFQGQYPPPPSQQQPSIGFPQPAPPPGVSASSTSPYYPPPHHGYQAVPGYAVVEGRPVREHRLPCCGIGIGWLLFVLGFFFAAIPWYAGAIIIICARVDYREKPGYVACTIAAVLASIAAVLGVTKGVDAW